MSHVASIDLHIHSLDALKKACEALGLEFREGQTTYRWYGRSVGDYPLPEGFTEADLGKCEHAIAVKGNARAYEVGVVKRRDGKAGYTLVWDFFAGGYGLQDRVGKDCSLLKQRYGVEVAKAAAKRKGFTVHETRQSDGTIQLTAKRG